ncbi:MAG: hypothetical protein R2698_13330 [Microthrixaceae bacterium]
MVRLGGAWAEVGGRRLKVLDARLDESGTRFVPVIVQPESKGPMPYEVWRRALPPGVSDPFA